MKYLILTALILIGCNNTTAPFVCEEYVSVYVITVNKGNGVFVHHSYPYPQECSVAELEFEEQGYPSSCQRIVDNVGCN